MTQQQQIDPNYANALIREIEEQRNRALAEAAQAKADFRVLSARLTGIADLIKRHSLEKYFDGSFDRDTTDRDTTDRDTTDRDTTEGVPTE
jgi:hypothetical protein